MASCWKTIQGSLVHFFDGLYKTTWSDQIQGFTEHTTLNFSFFFWTWTLFLLITFLDTSGWNDSKVDQVTWICISRWRFRGCCRRGCVKSVWSPVCKVWDVHARVSFAHVLCARRTFPWRTPNLVYWRNLLENSPYDIPFRMLNFHFYFLSIY